MWRGGVGRSREGLGKGTCKCSVCTASRYTILYLDPTGLLVDMLLVANLWQPVDGVECNGYPSVYVYMWV